MISVKIFGQLSDSFFVAIFGQLLIEAIIQSPINAAVSRSVILITNPESYVSFAFG